MRTILILTASLTVVTGAPAAPPKVADDRLVLELVAREPDIVTPTGIAVDEQGRVWVIENQTHHRPPNYKGHDSDRIRVFSDFDDTGRARKITTFADGFRDSMGIALGKDGTVFLATRSTIWQLREQKDGSVERKELLKLETTGNYPHNGLCGFAFDGTGRMHFGMGENLGAPYKLIGSDKTTLEGGGEGGNLFCCQPDGTGLQRVATGFWNPFHHCFDAFGRLFVVDNDPDSRGPCRLVHVVQGGDYGYRFRYGRKGTHPFQAWNGELPGTLPMVAGTGEAPSGIVAYESNGLPAEYRGSLLSTSWGDHVVERFTLVPEGASFRAQAQTLIRGGDDFRPVGVAVGPDGSVYFSDWVDKSYPVHGKGKIWRLRMKTPPKDDGLRPSKVAGLDLKKLEEELGDPRREIRAAAAAALAGRGNEGFEALLRALESKSDSRARLAVLWAAIGPRNKWLQRAAILKRLKEPPLTELREAMAQLNLFQTICDKALISKAPEVRAEAVRLNEVPLDTVLKDVSPFVRFQGIVQQRQPEALKQIVPLLADKDPFIASAALEALGRPNAAEMLLTHVDAADPRLRLGVLLALRRSADKDARKALPKFLEDADPEVRRTAIQWVGEERLKDLEPQMSAAAARDPVTRDLFLALLASKHLLGGGKPDKEPVDEKYLGQVVADAGQPVAFRVLAAQMLRPDHPALSVDQLQKLVASKEPALRRVAARTLALRPDAPAQQLLAKLAADREMDAWLRSEAVLGLGHSAAASTETQQLLLSLLEQPELRREALRSLRGAVQKTEVEKAVLAWWDKFHAATGQAAEERREIAAQLLLALKSSKSPEMEKRRKTLTELADARPKDTEGWQRFLTDGGDAVAGERVFFHAQGPRCVICHRVEGRGGMIGPDLSTIGQALKRDKLIESVLLPSKEIAPMFVAWSILTTDGKVHTGVIVDEGPNSTITVADTQGKLEVLKRQDVEERHALNRSIMPDDLHALMTPREFRDLIAFLGSRK